MNKLAEMIALYKRVALDETVPAHKSVTPLINKVVETTESPVPTPKRFAAPEMEGSEDGMLAIIFIQHLLLWCF